ncbi:RNA-binding S4 domain-containing protein [Alkalibacter saccharofermentans]|uniref:Ribosome-associated protein n=1 Tax=Alkalibacter saccharofermentans DSM 14828 TaxID=1120975 RepID=A0A1M4T6L7_9FIRM|nr:RNA-binding S4 domain-containing protein [Alkalibacter saccharofermentans]SHE40070.1 ribosome-associated protein [Alkalibacter saccharofermentans DSM 14828]
MNATSVGIKTEFIKLDQFLKFAGIAESGSYAKMMILDGIVSVNGEICIQRGKKIYPDDTIEIADYEEKFKVIKDEE